ncbi:DUF6522 family protein [Acuticoccus kandeliae]|uniref:DUF6522 family protein n=1 Tax=Acuticoccus kandeliae TaxID=2073160 RepID=UPI001B3B956A|nr:DUF6522 family protein [Acuticoccus kandeliae]
MTTRLLPRSAGPKGPRIAAIERDGDGFVVPAELLGEAFGLPVSQVQDAMRAGSITSRFEIGTGADSGRWRLTFYYGGRAYRLIVDENGLVISRSA